MIKKVKKSKKARVTKRKIFLGTYLGDYARGSNQESWCTKGARDVKKRSTREYLDVVMTRWTFDNLVAYQKGKCSRERWVIEVRARRNGAAVMVEASGLSERAARSNTRERLCEASRDADSLCARLRLMVFHHVSVANG